jgi:alpha-glucosidase
MLLLTLRGTPTLYYGDELGIGHVEIAPHFIRDPWAKYEPGLGVGRDPVRTPMQWDASAFAGFSTHEPWLPLAPDYEARNVVAMTYDKTSILFLVRSLLHYRREHETLSQGEWRLLSRESDVRRNGDNRIFVVLNFTANPQVWSAPPSTKATVAISTHGDRRGEHVGSTLCLRANEGLLIEPA